jgi:hypothetical protein
VLHLAFSAGSILFGVLNKTVQLLSLSSIAEADRVDGRGGSGFGGLLAPEGRDGPGALRAMLGSMSECRARGGGQRGAPLEQHLLQPMAVRSSVCPADIAPAIMLVCWPTCGMLLRPPRQLRCAPKGMPSNGCVWPQQPRGAEQQQQQQQPPPPPPPTAWAASGGSERVLLPRDDMRTTF